MCIFMTTNAPPIWIRGLVYGVECFGGVPHEVLFDNAKTIMNERDAYASSQHRWNAVLLSITNNYGFIPRLSILPSQRQR
jgi:transposase